MPSARVASMSDDVVTGPQLVSRQRVAVRRMRRRRCRGGSGNMLSTALITSLLPLAFGGHGGCRRPRTDHPATFHRR
jgi:hypothetical protein